MLFRLYGRLIVNQVACLIGMLLPAHVDRWNESARFRTTFGPVTWQIFTRCSTAPLVLARVVFSGHRRDWLWITTYYFYHHLTYRNCANRSIMIFTTLCHCHVNGIWFASPSIHIWRHSPFRALASFIRRLHSSLFSAVTLHPLIPSSCNASLWTTYPLCLCPTMLFPVMPVWGVYILLTKRAEIAALRSCIMFEHSMCQKSIPFPCSQVVIYLLNPSEASLRFPERKFFSGLRYPNAQPPTCRTRLSLFVWVITFDLFGLGDPASSYATAGLALRIIWPQRPHHYVKIGTLSRGVKYLLDSKVRREKTNKMQQLDVYY